MLPRRPRPAAATLRTAFLRALPPPPAPSSRGPRTALALGFLTPGTSTFSATIVSSSHIFMRDFSRLRSLTPFASTRWASPSIPTGTSVMWPEYMPSVCMSSASQWWLTRYAWGA